jgi:hypothetical protein
MGLLNQHCDGSVNLTIDQTSSGMAVLMGILNININLNLNINININIDRLDFLEDGFISELFCQDLLAPSPSTPVVTTSLPRLDAAARHIRNASLRFA